jgi:SAM-dependent methyltransferase
MDSPAASRKDLAEALRFIRIVNRYFGGTAAALWHLRHWLEDWPRQQPIRMLDVGAGSADIPLAIANWAQTRGYRIHITAIDFQPVTVALAQEHVGRRSDITVMQADALKLTDIFGTGSGAGRQTTVTVDTGGGPTFHFAHAGMFLHHLGDLQVMTVLRMMDRLTSHGVIWNDLVRSPLGRVGVRLLTRLFAAPAKARHDAIVSVNAGFTKPEAMDLARRAGLTDPRYRRFLWGRFTVASWKGP